MKKLSNLFLGKPKDPLSKNTQTKIALVAFLAWVGLGSDGLSSANYGPAHAYIALGKYHHLALYLAVVTAVTVFLIASAYNQVIRLFPNGGGGYKVSTSILGPYAGLVSGVTLVIDYALTIATSVASGTEAIFSLLPKSYLNHELLVEIIVLAILLYVNLRGSKESIKILLPIFLGFVITHVIIIITGIYMHDTSIPAMLHSVHSDTAMSFKQLGGLAVLALFMRAYAVGAGTYTGLEAVSNNVNILKEPRVKTGKWTMFYMALSLSILASGIILLYLLWSPVETSGMTLNAVVFGSILSSFLSPHISHISLIVLMLFEGGILFVAANTGFLGGPAVLANMASDAWVPKQFSILSSRLVKQNGIFFFGILAAFILLLSDGNVSFLIILYSLNVFITFSLSLLGLTVYFIKNRQEKFWFGHLLLSFIAFLICLSILISAFMTKFLPAGWITIIIIAVAIYICFIIRRHYKRFDKLKVQANKSLKIPLKKTSKTPPNIDPSKQTAVFLVSELGGAIHAFLWVQRLFPNSFQNVVFVSQGNVDIGSFGSDKAIKRLKYKTGRALRYLVKYAQQEGFAAESYVIYGTDSVNCFLEKSKEINEKYSNCVYFASRYLYPKENWFLRLLHSNIVPVLQRKLQQTGSKMLVLPLKL